MGPAGGTRIVTAFLDADSYEGAIRRAVSLGGGVDTLACITGGIAGALYGVPSHIATPALTLLDEDLQKGRRWFCFLCPELAIILCVTIVPLRSPSQTC